jgi:hypothetical protein
MIHQMLLSNGVCVEFFICTFYWFCTLCYSMPMNYSMLHPMNNELEKKERAKLVLVKAQQSLRRLLLTLVLEVMVIGRYDKLLKLNGLEGYQSVYSIYGLMGILCRH